MTEIDATGGIKLHPPRQLFFGLMAPPWIPQPTSTHRGPPPLDEIDGADHLEAELDAALGVVDARRRQPRHAVVAVAQQLDPQAVALLQKKS